MAITIKNRSEVEGLNDELKKVALATWEEHEKRMIEVKEEKLVEKEIFPQKSVETKLKGKSLLNNLPKNKKGSEVKKGNKFINLFCIKCKNKTHRPKLWIDERLEIDKNFVINYKCIKCRKEQ